LADDDFGDFPPGAGEDFFERVFVHLRWDSKTAISS
jgi:hypothetical protein